MLYFGHSDTFIGIFLCQALENIECPNPPCQLPSRCGGAVEPAELIENDEDEFDTTETDDSTSEFAEVFVDEVSETKSIEEKDYA